MNSAIQTFSTWQCCPKQGDVVGGSHNYNSRAVKSFQLVYGSVGELNEGRSGAGVVEGGCGEGQNTLSSKECYDLAIDTWTTWTCNMSMERRGMGVGLIDKPCHINLFL